MNHVELLVRLAYLFVVTGLLWAIVCRANRMSKATTKTSVRITYAVVGAMVVAAWSLPFWRHDWAQWAALLLGSTHLITTVINSKAWRNGPPPHARSRPAAFDDSPHHHPPPKGSP